MQFFNSYFCRQITKGGRGIFHERLSVSFNDFLTSLLKRKLLERETEARTHPHDERVSLIRANMFLRFWFMTTVDVGKKLKGGKIAK